jgi:UDP-glucose 4-epimerase
VKYSTLSTREITVLELVKRSAACQHTGGVKAQVCPLESFTGRKCEDVRRRVPDVSVEHPGVKAKVGLEEGLLRTIEWQRRVTQPMKQAEEASGISGL